MFSNFKNLNSDNLSNENKLIDDLEHFFPEKFLKLVGNDYDICDLRAFLKEKNFPNAYDFDVDAFLLFAKLTSISNAFHKSQAYKITNQYGIGFSASAINPTKGWIL